MSESVNKFIEAGSSQYSFWENYEAVIQDLPKIENAAVADVAAETIRLISQAVEKGNPVGYAGCRIYERKGYFSLDSLDGERNRGYAAEDDDVMLQVTVRVPYDQAKAYLSYLNEVNAEVELERLEAILAAKESEKSAIEEEIKQLKARVNSDG